MAEERDRRAITVTDRGGGVLVIAGEQPVDAASVKPAKERPDSIDREWREEPAFGGAPDMAGPTGAPTN